jgi:resuscitation-promoting factor RpfA
MSARLRLPARASSTSGSPTTPARRGTLVRGLAVAGAAAFLATGATACNSGGGGAPSASQLYALRMCESGGNYRINTGNGFYGAYQFDLGTWRGLGKPGYPHTAAPAVQDAAVRQLYAQRGWAPWPSCGRRARNA